MLTTLLTVNLFSQINDVVASDSLTKSLDLDNLRKISFKDGNVIATYSDGTSQSRKLSGSDKLQFTTDKQDEEVSEGASRYTIYDLSGRKMFNGHVLLSEGEKCSMVNGKPALRKGLYISDGQKVLVK